jgi:predicted transcriptional regulator
VGVSGRAEHPPYNLADVGRVFGPALLFYQHHLLIFQHRGDTVNPRMRAKPKLSRREQEVLDIVYARGHATAAEVRDTMQQAPTDAAVRTTLRILVGKGHLRIEQDGPRYNYWPTVSPRAVRRSELQHVLKTFFGGSTESALATLLDLQSAPLGDAARRRLKQLIDKAAREGR